MEVEFSPINSFFLENNFSGPGRAKRVWFLLLVLLKPSLFFLFFLNLICPRKSCRAVFYFSIHHFLSERVFSQLQRLFSCFKFKSWIATQSLPQDVIYVNYKAKGSFIRNFQPTRRCFLVNSKGNFVILLCSLF